jgi:hypothetical protein
LVEEVVAKAEVGFYPKEKPGMGQALKGQMLITRERFVYVKYAGGKYLTAKAADYGSRIDEGLRNEGSFAVPLNQITEARGDRTWGTPYFRLRYHTPSGEQAASFTFVKAMNAMAVSGVLGVAMIAKNPGDQLAQIISRLKLDSSS